MSTESFGDRMKRQMVRPEPTPTDSPIPARSTAAFEAHLARTSAVAHESMAAKLWAAADVLGTSIGDVEMMGNHLWEAIEREGDAADKIVIEGRDVAKALRVLAMRLDRAVMVKCGGGD
jgi:hypothetical protein